jgi:hypothetical protein
MSTDFSIEFHGDYIHVLHSPGFEVTPQSTAKLWAALAAECKTYNCRRVLREGKLGQRKMNWVTAYDSAVQATNVIRGLRIACCFENHTADEMTDFFKMVASNRGVDIDFFPNRHEALRWLGVANGKSDCQLPVAG